ncbi:MAG: hypothetical protein WCL27_13210 [Betaproteobacteria bacterium]
MLNFVNRGRKIASRRLLIALGVSLLLHTAVLLRFGLFSSSGMVSRSSPLQVSLVDQPGLLPVERELAQQFIPKVLPITQEVKASKLYIKSRTAPAIQEKPVESAITRLSSPPSTETPVKEITQTNQPSGVTATGLAGPVTRAEIVFEIRSGADGFVVGMGRHTYASQNGQIYGVSIQQGIKTEDAVPGEVWQLQISGIINQGGLNPLTFQAQGTLPERMLSLKEVSSNPTEPANKARKVRMRDGLIDRQSLLYQFMHKAPALAGGQLWLSDGTVHGLYSYHVAGFESLSIVSQGEVHTIKLLFSSSESSETIELWLIPDSHYLPAKMRHTDKRGVVTEQVTVSLDFK